MVKHACSPVWIVIDWIDRRVLFQWRKWFPKIDLDDLARSDLASKKPISCTVAGFQDTKVSRNHLVNIHLDDVKTTRPVQRQRSVHFSEEVETRPLEEFHGATKADSNLPTCDLTSEVRFIWMSQKQRVDKFDWWIYTTWKGLMAFFHSHGCLGLWPLRNRHRTWEWTSKGAKVVMDRHGPESVGHTGTDHLWPLNCP